jgi:hypothetical protein
MDTQGSTGELFFIICLFLLFNLIFKWKQVAEGKTSIPRTLAIFVIFFYNVNKGLAEPNLKSGLLFEEGGLVPHKLIHESIYNDMYISYIKNNKENGVTPCIIYNKIEIVNKSVVWENFFIFDFFSLKNNKKCDKYKCQINTNNLTHFKVSFYVNNINKKHNTYPIRPPYDEPSKI